MNREYKEKLVFLVMRHYAKRLFLPALVRHALCVLQSMPRIARGIKSLLQRRLTVEVLDGTAIGASLLTGDYSTASSVRFLLRLGETLEEWTHKRSVDNLALKLSMPLSMLSVMSEAGRHKIIVKGGKFMEKISEADTVIFDKTGTLTHACPTVVKVEPFHGEEADEMLRIAACLEEYFPHSVANAVVRAANERGLDHKEMHSEVEYVVAHGIATKIDGSRAVIAREVADITIAAEDLRELVYLKILSYCLMKRIHGNYRLVIGFNGMLILLVALGLIAPAASALLHNTSTLLLGMHSMTKLVEMGDDSFMKQED